MYGPTPLARLLISSQVLWATWAVVWPEPCLYLFSVNIWNRYLVDCLYLFSVNIWSRYLVDNWKQITFHTSPTFLFFEHLSLPALQVYQYHLWPASWDCLLFWPGPQFLFFRVSIWHRFLIAFRRLPLFLITTCSLGRSVRVLPLIGSVCQPPSCRSVQVLQSLHLKQISFYISSLFLVCG